MNFKAFFLLSLVIASASALAAMDKPMLTSDMPKPDFVEKPVTLDLPVPEEPVEELAVEPAVEPVEEPIVEPVEEPAVEPVEEPTSLTLPAPDTLPEPCEAFVPIVKVPHHHYNFRKLCVSAPMVRVRAKASACTNILPLTKCFDFKIELPKIPFCSRPLQVIKPTCVPKIPLCKPILKAPVVCGRTLPKFSSKSSTFTSTINNPLQSCAKASASASTTATY